MSDEIYLSPEAEKDLALAKFADAKEILETVCEAVRIAFAKSDEFAHIHMDELESVMNKVYDVMENEIEFHARNSGISHDISIRQIVLKCKHDALLRQKKVAFVPLTPFPTHISPKMEKA